MDEKKKGAVRGGVRRVREHEGTIADGIREHPALVLRVVGSRPRHIPYLRIGEVGDDRCVAWVENANAMRGLAHAILRALGDAAPTTTKAKVKKPTSRKGHQ